MRFPIILAAVVALARPVAAQVQIHHAALRVTVIPEARTDVFVGVLKANPHMRITVQKMGGQIILDGGLGVRNASCAGRLGQRGVRIAGLGFVPYDDLPQVIVRTPLDAKVSAGGAVFGVVGRSNALELSQAGCGDWTVADVVGSAKFRSSGSGDIRAGSIGSASVRISGSADVFMQTVHGGLDAATAGSGDVRAERIDGPLHVRVAGSGDVIAPAGRVSEMKVAIAGSGDVRFGGVADSLEAAVLGSGDVVVHRVLGRVVKRTAGSGAIRIGG